jgi:hypothetical protein
MKGFTFWDDSPFSSFLAQGQTDLEFSPAPWGQTDLEFSLLREAHGK